MANNPRTEDLWIYLSILEIKSQANFARIAYTKILDKPETTNEQVVFASIHAFLAHCTIISKMLKAHSDHHIIGQILKVSDDSIMYTRHFKNHLEHYDTHLKDWMSKAGASTSIVNHYIADKQSFPIQNALFVTFYDPYTRIFTFVDEDFDLNELFQETQQIGDKAKHWLADKPLPSVND